MYKVVLIDDESIIVEGLQQVVDWSAYNCQVVALAQDAASGAGVIRDHRPDILFTDIKMPGMDGLELMRQLRRSGAMPVTVVLSGYDEFELVREAFRLGAYDYLLKGNISRTSLTRLVSGLREKLFPSAAGPAAAPRTGLLAGDLEAVRHRGRLGLGDGRRGRDAVGLGGRGRLPGRARQVAGVALVGRGIVGRRRCHRPPALGAELGVVRQPVAAAVADHAVLQPTPCGTRVEESGAIIPLTALSR